MRTTLLFLSFLFTLPVLTAQRTVPAADLIAQLNAGEDIALEGVTITGDLDFTSLDNSVREAQGDWASKQMIYRSLVPGQLSFTDCTFKGRVLGYRNETSRFGWEGSNGDIFNADFRREVSFENCRFEDEVAFKYSKFREAASFTDCRFRREVIFKYTKFRNRASFAGSEFNDRTGFKYAEFGEFVSFASADFENSAIFKYTEFPYGVTFANATFRSFADFKYTKFSKDSGFDGVDFGRRADFKYTKIGGRSFTDFLLQKL